MSANHANRRRFVAVARFSYNVALAATLSLGLAAPPAAAQAETETLAASVESAKALIARGRTAEAQALLQNLAAKDPRNNDIDFLLGLLAIEAADYDRAVRHFRAILVRDPGAVRVRLELARAFYLDHDYDNAYRQFQFARAGTSPPGVAASIDRYLAAIRLEKNWSYDVSIALAPDTNINNATSAREATLFGLPFQLDDSARRKSGVGLAVGGAAEFAPRIGSRLRLRLGASGQRREYGGKAFDDTVVALHAGPRLILPRWDVSPVATVFRRWYGGRLVNEGIGARVEGTHQLDGRTVVSGGVSGQHVRFPHSSGQTGAAFAAWGGVIRALTPASSVTVRGGLGRQEARADDQANWSGSVGVGYYRDLAGGFSVYVEPSLAFARYDAADLLFRRHRRDFGQELQVALLNRRIILSRFTPRIAYTFTRRRSTIDLFQFSQSRVEVGLTSRF